MNVALVLQWSLLAGYAGLLFVAALAGRRWPRVRPVAFAVGFVALTHVIYYVLFLIWPAVLEAYATMLFSIALRWMVLFVDVAMLFMALRRDR